MLEHHTTTRNAQRLHRNLRFSLGPPMFGISLPKAPITRWVFLAVVRRWTPNIVPLHSTTMPKYFMDVLSWAASSSRNMIGPPPRSAAWTPGCSPLSSGAQDLEWCPQPFLGRRSRNPVSHPRNRPPHTRQPSSPSASGTQYGDFSAGRLRRRTYISLMGGD